MDDKVIQRINGVLKRIDIVLSRMEGVSFNTFENDVSISDSVSFSLLQIGERMIKLEQLLKDKYPELPWSQAKKMRNIIAHDYDGVDMETVYNTAVVDLPILKKSFLKIKDDINHISENSLYTKRLWLRPWDDLDAQQLFELAKEPEIGYWCGWEPHKSVNESLFCIHNFLQIKETYAICLKENNEILGSISLMLNGNIAQNEGECELGFWIGKQYQRNGYAFEAAGELLRHAFCDLRISAIWCCYFEGNERSKFLQNKLGFVFHHLDKKDDRDRYINILTKEKWLIKNS